MEVITSTTGDDLDTVVGPINYLARLPIYASVKPYTLRFKPENECPLTNIEDVEHRVKIRNMRKHELSYDKCGFQYCRMSSDMKYEDYEERHLIETIHLPEVEARLKDVFKAPFVSILNYGIRRRHASFPVATGQAYQHMQPANRSHMDVTREACDLMLRRKLGSRAENILAQRWQYVNVWHPLRGPLFDWPLAVCDASTFDFTSDAMPIDVVSFDKLDEEFVLQHSPAQQWYYLPGQLPSELLIFKSMDSQTQDGVPFGTPHTAFDLESTSQSNMPRESIEMRGIVAW